MFLILCPFCFFITLFSNKDGVLSSNKAHCHPRLPKANLKIPLIYWNILGKHFSQATSRSKKGLQIASYTKISNIFLQTQYDGRSCQVQKQLKQFSQALTAVCNKINLQHKKCSCTYVFLCEFCLIYQNTLETRLVVTASNK